MRVRRLEHIPGFNIDRVAAAAGDDPDVLRMENLDTDIPPPAAALKATRAAIGEDDANSWLPFTDRAISKRLPVEVSSRLLAEKVATTPMRGWGSEIADRHVRFVFSNEPVEKLSALGDRVRRALAAANPGD